MKGRQGGNRREREAGVDAEEIGLTIEKGKVCEVHTEKSKNGFSNCLCLFTQITKRHFLTYL